MIKFDNYDIELKRTCNYVHRLLSHHKSESFEEHYRQHYNTTLSSIHSGKSIQHKDWLLSTLPKLFIKHIICHGKYYKIQILWKCLKDVFMYPLERMTNMYNHDIRRDIDTYIHISFDNIFEIQKILYKLSIPSDIIQLILLYI